MIQREIIKTSAALPTSLPARVVDKDAAHDARRDGEEVRAILPRYVLGIDEPEIGLVHERGGLKTMPGPLAGHAAPRDLMEFLMDERDQPREGFLVALPPGQQQSGDVRGFLRNAFILGLFSTR